jgi:hypothetical protein
LWNKIKKWEIETSKQLTEEVFETTGTYILKPKMSATIQISRSWILWGDHNLNALYIEQLKVSMVKAVQNEPWHKYAETESYPIYWTPLTSSGINLTIIVYELSKSCFTNFRFLGTKYKKILRPQDLWNHLIDAPSQPVQVNILGSRGNIRNSSNFKKKNLQGHMLQT